MHEILISEEEAHRTVDRGDYYAIRPMLPELRTATPAPSRRSTRSTARRDDVMTARRLPSSCERTA